MLSKCIKRIRYFVDFEEHVYKDGEAMWCDMKTGIFAMFQKHDISRGWALMGKMLEKQNTHPPEHYDDGVLVKYRQHPYWPGHIPDQDEYKIRYGVVFKNIKDICYYIKPTGIKSVYGKSTKSLDKIFWFNIIEGFYNTNKIEEYK
jgi:hypothetical protein